MSLPEASVKNDGKKKKKKKRVLDTENAMLTTIYRVVKIIIFVNLSTQVLIEIVNVSQ